MSESAFCWFTRKVPIEERAVWYLALPRFASLILVCFVAAFSGHAEARYEYELEFGENRVNGLHCDFYRVSSENGGVWWHCHGDRVVGGRLVSRVDNPITPSVSWSLMARASLVAYETRDASASYDIELCPEVRFAENGTGKFVTGRNRMLKVEERRLSFGDVPPFLAQCARLLDGCKEGGVVMCSSGFAEVRNETVRYALFMSRRGNLLLAYEAGASGARSVHLEVADGQVVVPRELSRCGSPNVRANGEWELFAGNMVGSKMRSVEFTICRQRIPNGRDAGLPFHDETSVRIDVANILGLSDFMRNYEYHGKTRWQVDRLVLRRFEEAF